MTPTPNQKLHLAEPHEKLLAVFDRMRQYDIRHLPVVDDGRLIGIISDRDVLLHAWSGRPRSFPDDMLVRDVMSKDVVSVPLETSLAEAAQVMVMRKIDALPLTDAAGELVGIVTSSDVIRLVAERRPELCEVHHSKDFMSQFRWDMPEII